MSEKRIQFNKVVKNQLVYSENMVSIRSSDIRMIEVKTKGNNTSLVSPTRQPLYIISNN